MSKTASLHYDLCCEGAKWLRRQKWNYQRCQKKQCYRTEACGDWGADNELNEFHELFI